MSFFGYTDTETPRRAAHCPSPTEFIHLTWKWLQVLFMIAAHNKMASRNEAVMAILREMVAAEGSGMSCMRLAMENLEPYDLFVETQGH